MKVHLKEAPSDWDCPIWLRRPTGEVVRSDRDQRGTLVARLDNDPPKEIAQAIDLVQVANGGHYVGDYYRINKDGEVEVVILHPTR